MQIGANVDNSSLALNVDLDLARPIWRLVECRYDFFWFILIRKALGRSDKDPSVLNLDLLTLSSDRHCPSPKLLIAKLDDLLIDGPTRE